MPIALHFPNAWLDATHEAGCSEMVACLGLGIMSSIKEQHDQMSLQGNCRAVLLSSALWLWAAATEDIDPV